MKVGMLWFDGDHRAPLGERIARACAYYEQKYGEQPNLCFINPQSAASEEGLADSLIRVEVSASVLPDHFWIGVEEQPEGAFAGTAEVMTPVAA